MRPESTGSSRLTQRRRVLLPLPLGPMTTSTSPSPTLRSMPSRTTLSPKLLRTPSSSTIGAPRVALASAPATALSTGLTAGVECPRRVQVKNVDGVARGPYPPGVVERKEEPAMKASCRTPHRLDGALL